MKSGRSGGLGRPAAVASVLALVSAASAAALAWGGGPAQAGSAGVRLAAVTGDITTVAGGVGGPGPGTDVSLGLGQNAVCGISYGSGSLYVADSGVVRKVNPQTGGLTTPAGTGTAGPLGDGGPAASAELSTCGTTVDHSGNLVIADWGGSRIRVVAASDGTFYGQAMTAGHIYTVAGNGLFGYAGDTRLATAAKLDGPPAVAVDAAGNLVIADSGNDRIRVVAAKTGTYYGQAMTARHIYTVAGNGTTGFSGDGGPATAAGLYYPDQAAVDAAGNLVIADGANDRVRVVAAGDGTFYGQAMTAGNIYTVAGNGTTGFSGEGGPATSAELDSPRGVTVDGAGNLVIADRGNNRVRVVAAGDGTFYRQAMTAGDIYTVAGSGTLGFSGEGGPATGAELASPDQTAVDGDGNLVIADGVNGRVRVVAAGDGTFYGQAMTAGNIYTVAGNGVGGFSGDGGPATSAELNGPRRVTVDGARNQLIADRGNNRIRVVAAVSGAFYGQAMIAGNIYTVAGNGTLGFSGEGGPATAAELAGPDQAAVDGAGNLVIADTGNHRVRVVAANTGTFYGQAMTAGDIYTVAGSGLAGFTGEGGVATTAKLDSPQDVALDGAGNLVIADGANNRIRVVAPRAGTFYGRAMTKGHIYTVAGNGTFGFSGDGGAATAAELRIPEDVVVDGAGNLVIADSGNNRVRVVAASTGTSYGQAMTAGDIYTVAGNGTFGFSGDSGPATAAELGNPGQAAVDGAGNLVIADSGNNRVRVVAAGDGTFYGQAMTAGDIYTVAGNGTGGFSGDGGPATSAELNHPQGVTVDAAGDLMVVDMGSNRIREVAG
jgi:trimeric autotransporter adhesin